jgi:hypothetical protein
MLTITPPMRFTLSEDTYYMLNNDILSVSIHLVHTYLQTSIRSPKVTTKVLKISSLLTVRLLDLLWVGTSRGPSFIHM